MVSLQFDHLVSLVSEDFEFRDLLLQTVQPVQMSHSLRFFRRGEAVPVSDCQLLSGLVKDGIAWSSGVAVNSRIPLFVSSSRTVAVFESRPNPESMVFCRDLCNALRVRGGNPVLLTSAQYLPNYGMSVSDLAERAPIAVMRHLQQLALRYSHCILFVALSSSLAWAKECCCAAQTILMVEPESVDSKEEDPSDTYAILSAIPTRTENVSRETVVLRKVTKKKLV